MKGRTAQTIIAILLLAVSLPTGQCQDKKVDVVKNWQPLPGETFDVNGKAAFLIRPTKAAEGKPWILYAPTFKNGTPNEKDEGWMFQRFLTAGIAIVGVDVGESYGSPDGRAVYTALYEKMTKDHGFAKKACLLARSRGGLMIYNWASENSDKVACIAGIYPVLDLTTYPGLDKACGAYKLDAAQLRDKLKEHNPVDRLESLARKKVPAFHIHGDKDTVVPYEQNATEPARRYKAFGGSMTILLAKDQGHSYWPGFFKCQELVDFIIKNAGN